MSHDQLPSEKKTNDLPSIDETVKPEAEFQYQEDQGLSSQQAQRLAKLEAKDRRTKRVVKGTAIGGGALMLLGVVGSFVPNFVNGGGNSSNPDLNPDKSTSGPAVAGEWSPSPEANYTPSDQVPFLLDSDPSLDVIKDPAILSEEQVSAWQSGDAKVQSDIASNVIAPRISYAVHELYDAKMQDQVADVSWLTTDETALAEVERIADQFVEVSKATDPGGYEWFGFDLCRSDKQEGLDALIDICAPENFPADATTNFAEGSPMDFAVTFATSEHDEFTEGYARRYEFDNTTVRLKGDTLVIEPIA